MSIPVNLRAQPEQKRLVFSSRLTTNNRQDAETALHFIFKVGVERNTREGIRGLLYFNPDTFNVVQVLEGPIDNVNALFKDIAQDGRHTRVSRIYDSRVLQQELWVSEQGLAHGKPSDWAKLKNTLSKVSPSSYSDVQHVNLEAIDTLPIAGDLDLRLIRLLYYSRFKETNELRAFSIMQDIVEKAQRKNERYLVGGVLHMNRKTLEVFQCLEGPANVVKTLYCAIENDSRHRNVETLILETIDKRRYNTWGMVWANEEARTVLRESLSQEVLDKYGHLLGVNNDEVKEKR